MLTNLRNSARPTIHHAQCQALTITYRTLYSKVNAFAISHLEQNLKMPLTSVLLVMNIFFALHTVIAPPIPLVDLVATRLTPR